MWGGTIFIAESTSHSISILSYFVKLNAFFSWKIIPDQAAKYILNE